MVLPITQLPYIIQSIISRYNFYTEAIVLIIPVLPYNKKWLKSGIQFTCTFLHIKSKYLYRCIYRLKWDTPASRIRNNLTEEN